MEDIHKIALVIAAFALAGILLLAFLLAPKEPKIEEYMKSVSGVRGLEFDHPVPVRTMTREDLRKYLTERMDREFPPEKFRKAERTLIAFGVFPRDRDLRETVLDLYGQWASGFYDHETKELYLIEGNGDMMREYVIIHELTHALQDQHFDLWTLPAREENNDDLSLAVRALVEGDAEYTTLDYVYRKRGQNLRMFSALVRSGVLRMMNTAEPIPGIPENFPIFLTKIFMFPYTGGLLFVMEGWTENWDKINRAYADPPASTEQILHPEKYFENRDHPTLLTLPDLMPVLGAGWELQENNNFGEYGLGVLLLHFFRESADIEKNLEARNGWDGDSYLTYYNENEGVIALAWLTTWDSEGDSAEFHRRYSELLKKKYPDAETFTEGENLLILKTENYRVLLQRKRKDVLVLEGIPAHYLQNVSAEVWRNTRRHELKSVVRNSQE